jgi:hypothetical protein
MKPVFAKSLGSILLESLYLVLVQLDRVVLVIGVLLQMEAFLHIASIMSHRIHCESSLLLVTEVSMRLFPLVPKFDMVHRNEGTTYLVVVV